MITSDGSIKITTELNENMQKELTKTTFAGALAAVITGGIGVAAFLALYITLIFLDKENETIFIYLVLFGALLGGGIGMMIVVNKANKSAKVSGKVNVYEFFKGYFYIDEYLNGERVGKAKFYDNQIIKSKETANYFFFYVTSVAAFPVAKAGLSEGELNALRTVFGRASKGDAVILSAGAAQPVQQEPEDPFDGLGR